MPSNAPIMPHPVGPPPIWGNPTPHDRPGHHHPGFEISSLNEFTGYFSTDNGDWPVIVVANNIEEASKILRMPGAYKPESSEPMMVKLTKNNIGVARPVHRIGFNTTIKPDGAIISGATATPKHFEVINGDNVIFTATQPFGWKFLGWYKGFSSQPEDTWILLSEDLVTEINVYDPYSTLLEYIAFYEFKPELNSGRYIDIDRGTLYDFRFETYSNYNGRVVYSPDTANVYNWVISVLDVPTKTINCIPEPMLIQPEQIPITFTYEESPIGLNLIVQAIPVTNPMGFTIGDVIHTKWIQPQGPHYYRP